MKNKIGTALIVLVFGASIVITSCDKDDDFHSIAPLERSIHNRVNEYRISQDLSTLVEQFLMFEEARKISDKLAKGTYESGDPRIQEDINNFTVLLNGSSNGSIIMAVNTNIVDSIFDVMFNSPGGLDIIEGQFTQSGVGVSADADGIFHICHIFMNIE